MKSFVMELVEREEIYKGTYTEKKNNICRTELMLTDNTLFSEIYHFIEEIKVIYEKARAIIDNRGSMELSISVAVYKNWETQDMDKKMKQVSYDRWVSVPTEEQGKESIYLKPDTRYTPENRDMFLFEDILEDIACGIDGSVD